MNTNTDRKLDMSIPARKEGMIVTRFAPSPTGPLHVGSVRTLLYNYILARQQKGIMVMRIEDTDKVRSTKAHEQYIYDSLEWLGIQPDEIYVQSQRYDVLNAHLARIIAEDKAYISREKNPETGKENDLVRFRNPNTVITFTDIIRGEISFDTTELGDFVIARSPTDPLFHFAVVVDDFEMGITHIIRGEDHISNTPRQILIQQAIGAPRPQYAHLPLILAEDRSKLSKRKHGELVATMYYKQQGYLPEALLNFSALVGWNPGNDKEVYSMDELIADFSLERVHKHGAIFDIKKLRHINMLHIEALDPNRKNQLLKENIEKACNTRGISLNNVQYSIVQGMILPRIALWSDIQTMFDSGEFDFLKADFMAQKESLEYVINPMLLVWKKSDVTKTIAHISFAITTLEAISEQDWSEQNIKNSLWEYAEKNGKGDVLWPLRYALSNKEKSPDPFVLSTLIGKYETITRLNYAQQVLEKNT